MSVNGMPMEFTLINYIGFKYGSDYRSIGLGYFYRKVSSLNSPSSHRDYFGWYFYVFPGQKKKFSQLKGAVPFLMGAGAVSAILSCVFGYMLSFQGGYDAEALNSHQWMGVALAVFAVLAFVFMVWEKTKRIVVLQSGLMVFLLVGLGYTGHMGGNLTHGASYLTQYSPDPLRKLVGLPPKPEKRPRLQSWILPIYFWMLFPQCFRTIV